MMANPANAMEIALRPIQEWGQEKAIMKLELIENIRTQLSPLQIILHTAFVYLLF